MKIKLELTTEQKRMIRKMLNKGVSVDVQLVTFDSKGMAILEGVEPLRVTWVPSVMKEFKSSSIYKDKEDYDWFLILE